MFYISNVNKSCSSLLSMYLTRSIAYYIKFSYSWNICEVHIMWNLYSGHNHCKPRMCKILVTVCRYTGNCKVSLPRIIMKPASLENKRLHTLKWFTCIRLHVITVWCIFLLLIPHIDLIYFHRNFHLTINLSWSKILWQLYVSI